MERWPNQFCSSGAGLSKTSDQNRSGKRKLVKPGAQENGAQENGAKKIKKILIQLRANGSPSPIILKVKFRAGQITGLIAESASGCSAAW